MQDIHHLSIDLETRSDVDIGKCGSYRYAQSDAFEILLLAYAFDDDPVTVIDLKCGEHIPDDVFSALTDERVIKHAFNAAFEWWCLNQAGYETPIGQWRCTMVNAYYHGLPGSLEAAGEVLGLDDGQAKLDTGKALIRYFCNPCKPTKTNGGRTWNNPEHDPDKWALFKEYNARDVEAEREILRRLRKLEPMPETEEEYWRMDIGINARGVRVDRGLVEGAIELGARANDELLARAVEITGLENPKSPKQLKEWLSERLGREVKSTAKDAVEKMLAEEDLPDDVREMLLLKQKLGKTSVTKFNAMELSKGPDDRVRGSLQFYGANRTGRWAGRVVQTHNLPRNSLRTLDSARRLVKERNYDAVKLIYGNVPDTLSQLVRTAFIPSEGHKFIVSDFSAIEARILAWLTGEQWVMDVFANDGDIYCETASQMFHVPVVKHGINGELRQKGKIATLALGYQGHIGAMISMGALDMGITEEELPEIVNKWRASHPRTVQFWNRLETAAKKIIALKNPSYRATLNDRIELRYEDRYLTIRLPSGRKLWYFEPYISKGRRSDETIWFSGVNQTTKKWEEIETFGGKLTENIVQAVGRDCLAVTLMRCVRAGYQPVMHIHDEIVIDAAPEQKLADVNAIFAEPINWAPGLILKGAGFEGPYYQKD